MTIAIPIDEALLARAQGIGGSADARSTVESALQEFVLSHRADPLRRDPRKGRVSVRGRLEEPTASEGWDPPG